MTGAKKPIDGTNPYGSIKDVPGGTLVDEKMLADAVVFFQRMAAMAGVTLNDLPDNSPNGFQFYQAFQSLVYAGWSGAGFVFNTSLGQVWQNSFSSNKFEYKIQGNMLFLAGIVKNTGSIVNPTYLLTLPVAARPLLKQEILAWHDGTAPGVVHLAVETSGQITTTNALDGNVYFGGVNIKLTTDSY